MSKGSPLLGRTSAAKSVSNGSTSSGKSEGLVGLRTPASAALSGGGVPLSRSLFSPPLLSSYAPLPRSPEPLKCRRDPRGPPHYLFCPLLLICKLRCQKGRSPLPRPLRRSLRVWRGTGMVTKLIYIFTIKDRCKRVWFPHNSGLHVFVEVLGPLRPAYHN